ncbi:MAG TPA: phosphatidate cytidylyltransferase [Candidatus Polarisedimenticolaceae bacterium]|nr:phosphatidate cytidylyltransferase [Candidatus Polarisedimenticolaceae bacterium]
MKRIVTAAILGLPAWYVCKRAPFPLFVVAVLVVASMAAWECAGILERRGWRPFPLLAVAGCVALVWGFAGLPPRLGAISALTALALAAPALAMLRRDEPAAMLDAAVGSTFPVLFVGLPLAFTVALRAVPGEDGPDLLLLALLCVVFADTAAYYVGSALGSHPMAPTISPKKSWEGAAGGIGGGIVAGLLAHFWFFQRLPLVHAVVLGAVLAVAGMAGDLAESMLKRAGSVKDSSTLLPGHGGLLDRVDSLLVAAPILYYYWRVLLAGTL